MKMIKSMECYTPYTIKKKKRLVNEIMIANTSGYIRLIPFKEYSDRPLFLDLREDKTLIFSYNILNEERWNNYKNVILQKNLTKNFTEILLEIKEGSNEK